MRSAIAGVALLMTVALAGDDQEKKRKDPPTDEAIIDLVGARLAKVFTQFGTPEDLRPIRSDDAPDLDTVFMEYSGFGFNVRQKTVQACYFFDQWKGKVKGINLGDSRDQVVKILGEVFEESQSENAFGVHDYIWDLQDIDAWLWVTFDKSEKVKRVAVLLKPVESRQCSHNWPID